MCCSRRNFEGGGAVGHLSSLPSSPPAPLEKRRNPCHLHCLALPIPRGDEGTFGKWMIEKASDYLRTWADYLKHSSKMCDESRIGLLRRIISFQIYILTQSYSWKYNATYTVIPPPQWGEGDTRCILLRKKIFFNSSIR